MAAQRGPHSSVQYVEPNRYDNISMFKESITVNGEPFEKIIDPEDYCIGVSITTSLCNRGFQVTDDKTAVTLNCDMTNSGSKVNFMSGRLVEAVNHKEGIPYLTTDYADMYVTDLQDYGTTEMIGIKSINIDFENAVLPVITIQFTDVRGMSLFTPKELSRLKNVPMGGQVTKDNVAQFFFQCFFKFPYPKFNITVKGFYGRLVSYEVTCDKFETNFNSETGDFDVTARFIGYRYSFLTDISLELLLAAPYCDFIGKQYWEEKKQSDFQVTNVYGAKVPMPTLVEIRNKIKDILTNGDPGQTETTITEEENTHDEERRSLEEIKKTYYSWYEQLIKEALVKYGDNCVFVDKNNGDYQRVIILIPNDYAANDMSQDYQQMYETQKVNNDLCALIDKYNETYGLGNKLDVISRDFKGYVKTPLFNKLTTKSRFNGFIEECKIPEMVVKRMMLSGNKDATLNTIFNEGSPHQYTHCFDINVDYSTIQSRINALTEDANKSYLQKRKERDIHFRNLKLMADLGFNPTISNVTKIVMAHLETLMHMIYNVTDAIKNDSSRTPSAWGIDCGPDGTCPDVDYNTTRIPPFPRVTEKVDEGGNMKQQDMWIGLLDKDSIKEADLVETFFNAIEEIESLIHDWDKKIEEKRQAMEDAANGIERCVVKYPTTSFDFFLDSKLYNDDVVEDINKLSGAISLRMFSVLCLNFYANQCGKKAWGEKASQLGRIEAHNFVNSISAENNPKLREWVKLGSGELNADNIIKIIQSKDGKYPWSFDTRDKTAQPLFSSDNWVLRYKCNDSLGNSYMYPVQNISFENIKENYNIFKNGESLGNKDVLMSCPSRNISSIDLDSYNCHNSLIIEDNVNKVKNMLDKAMSESISSYTEVMSVLSGKSTLDEALDGYYKGLFKHNGCTSFSKVQNIKKKGDDFIEVYDINGGNDAFVAHTRDGYFSDDYKTKVIYSCSPEDLTHFLENETVARSVNSCFISEIFPYDNGKINHNSSLFLKDDFSPIEFLMGIDCIDYDYLRENGGFNRKLQGMNAFVYTPRLVVLQLGAVLAYNYATTQDLNQMIDVKLLPYGIPEKLDLIIEQYLNTINIYSRIALIKYFQDWENNEFKEYKSGLARGHSKANIAEVQKKPNSGDYSRVLLYEESPLVKKLTNSLVLPVLVVHGNVNHFTCGSKLEKDKYTPVITEYGRFTLPNSLYKLNRGVFENYLNAFVNELNQLLGVDYERDSNGNMVRRARTASNTSNDMRIELYRYLKQVYDKWIPSTTESDWNFKNFFDDEGGDGDYKFYFIDSYYNKIGDKLMINPRELANRLDTARSYSDINSSVYSLLGWIYGDNRCMFKCIQNFADFSNGKGIYDMFKPLPYSTAFSDKRQGSDFVVVYTYEPSKYLDINSSEYTNDGFMLNDIEETPLAVKSRSEVEYKIPAFGVTYGKQYQSYFKKISLDTKNAIQTQQALFAKHAILQGKTSKDKFGITGQDLFDIYTTQSYTCTVDMMGCAWVQPMMYFVLLNVPMFRGSYMIMKVHHRITPGDMSTTFTGCRMSNCANKFVQDIFISSEGDDTEYTSDNFTRINDLANVDNDCPYAVYSIFQGDGTLSRNILQNGKELMNKLERRGFNKIASAGIVGNIQQECGGNLDYTSAVVDSNNFIAGGLCGWNDKDGNLTHLLEKNSSNYGQPPVVQIASKLGVTSVRNKLREIGIEYQIQFIDETISAVTVSREDTTKYSKARLNACTSPEQAAESFRAAYERGTNSNARQNYARQFYDYTTTPQSEETTKMNEDIYPLFFNAVKQTCENTSSMRFTPTEEYFKTRNGKVLMMSTDTNNTPKLAKLFDCILNTPEYFKYVNNLYWVYENDPKTIVRVDVELSNKEVATNNQHVWWFRKGTRAENRNTEAQNNVLLLANLSDDANWALAKRFNADNNNVDKFKQLAPKLGGLENLSAYTLTDCSNVVTDGVLRIPSEISKGDYGFIDGWDIGKACGYLKTYAKNSSQGECAVYVERAIAAGGGPLSKQMACGGKHGWATNLRYDGILEKNGFVMIDKGIVEGYGDTRILLQPGDVAIIGKDAKKEGGKYHACMYCSQGWISDFKQRHMNPYSSSWPYAIYRFHNKKKS